MNEERAEDKGLAKLIAGKLGEQLRPGSSDCPDVEILACYFDNTLTEGEREIFETHLLACSRCQEHIAELARLSEADAPQVMIVNEAPADVEEESAPGWHFNLAWVGFALVLVVAVGFWQRARITSFFQPASETAENVSPAAAPAAPAGKKTAASNPIAKREAATTTGKTLGAPSSSPKAAAEPKGDAASRTVAANEFAKSEETARTATSVLNAPSPESQAAGGGSAGAERGDMATPSQGAGLGAVVQPGGRQIEMQPEKPNLQLTDRDVAREPVTTAAAPAPPPKPAPPSAHAKGFGMLAKKEAVEPATGASPITIQGLTAVYTPKWRVGRRGVIQKMEPNGNWGAVASGVDTDLFDITFAGSSAGWAVGHGGLVLRTTDGGNTWTKTASPSSEDLIHVSATSDLAARVITRRNRLFSTSDGGSSWTSLSPE